MCPVREFKIKNSKPPWVTNELLEQMKDRDYFYKKAKKYGVEDDWNIAKFCRNRVNSNVRAARADFIRDQLRNNDGNSAKFWRSIKQVMPSDKKGRANPNLNSKISFNADDNSSIHDSQTANYANNFFATTGQSTYPTTDACSPNLPKSQHSYRSDTGFSLEPITIGEVEKLIDKINIFKSSGMTLLSSKLLKDSFQALSKQLLHLYNLSIRTTIFPAQWKKGLVIPIPKTGDPKRVENYRPISLLPLPGKILEKLVHTQLSFYLEENEILSNNQFGFRKQRSTSRAISQLLNQIYININKSVVTTAVYIDFSKAFNCVQHDTLLNKLSHLNLDPNFMMWTASCLTGREQRTLVNNIYSSCLPVPQGVPQGSVLGPLLYIIYANDIGDRIKNNGFTFYADDTVLYSKKRSLEESRVDLQKDLDGLANWCVDNEIYINIDKTKAMFFGSRAKIESSPLPDFFIGDTAIQRAQTYTYLGIKLDEQLTLETHANSVIQRVSNRIYQLSKIRSYVTQKAALLIYKNMILPILEYGDIFLHSASQRVRKKLQILQNKALRCALHRDKYVKSDDLHKDAKLLKLKDRRHVHVLLHMFQLSQMPDFKLWKTHQSTGVRTRSSKKKLIGLRKPNNEKYKKSITYQGPKLWNSLPGSMQKIDSYHEFKTQVNKMFPLSKYKTKGKSKVKSQKSKSKWMKNLTRTLTPNLWTINPFQFPNSDPQSVQPKATKPVPYLLIHHYLISSHLNHNHFPQLSYLLFFHSLNSFLS